MVQFALEHAPAGDPRSLPGAQSDHTGALVLAVGESHGVGRALKALELQGFNTCVAGTTGDALASIAAAAPAVVLIDMDLPDGGALALCRRMKRDTGTRLIPLLLLHDPEQRQHRIDAIAAGADAFVAKPVDLEELVVRVRACARTREYTSDLDSAAAIIMTLTAMLESRQSSPGHCYRIANYAMALGRAVQLGDVDRQSIYRGAFLHDIGMLAIPDSILQKDGRLAPDEYEIVKSHPVIGDALCANLRSLYPVRPIVRHHHEHLDGSGYPDQLRGAEVPLLAQIVGIVDVFEAITMGRAYQPAQGAAGAIQALRGDVARGWRDHDLVETFVGLVHNGALGSVHGTDSSDAADGTS